VRLRVAFPSTNVVTSTNRVICKIGSALLVAFVQSAHLTDSLVLLLFSTTTTATTTHPPPPIQHAVSFLINLLAPFYYKIRLAFSLNLVANVLTHTHTNSYC
jgi:hypothetical protein